MITWMEKLFGAANIMGAFGAVECQTELDPKLAGGYTTLFTTISRPPILAAILATLWAISLTTLLATLLAASGRPFGSTCGVTFGGELGSNIGSIAVGRVSDWM